MPASSPPYRLLISYAHPDDESFGLGGLISRYVAEGVEVSLICATNGDVGTVKPELLDGYDSVAALRLAELDCAAAKLKLKHVVKLGYRDSGMMNSETTRDPASLWQAPLDEVTCRVVDVIRQVRPHVVLTFNKYGGYGHPDHIAIQRATTPAFTLAGDPLYTQAGGEPYTPQKLYYSGIPAAVLRIGIAIMRLRGQNPREVGRNKDIDMQAILDHVEPYHALINISRYYKAWEEASACHASQLGGGGFSIPNAIRKVIAPDQGFTRIHPAPRPGDRIERDLLAGVSRD